MHYIKFAKYMKLTNALCDLFKPKFRLRATFVMKKNDH